MRKRSKKPFYFIGTLILGLGFKILPMNVNIHIDKLFDFSKTEFTFEKNYVSSSSKEHYNPLAKIPHVTSDVIY